MNKKLKKILNYVLAGVFIFIVPTLLYHHFNEEDDEIFHQRVDEDHETCRQRAKEDSRETSWCREIKEGATLAYREARRDNSFYLLIMFQPLLFVLLISQYNLRKQVEELKEKIDV